MIIKIFSLLELIVAFALTAVITSACSSIFLDTRESSEFIWQLAQSERQSSAIIDALRKDLESLCPPNSNFDILRSNSREADGQRKDSLAFLSLRSSAQGPSLAEVEYLSSPGAQGELGFRIYRRFSTVCDTDLHNGGIFELLLKHVTQFKMDYLVQNEWTPLPTRLPQALHVQLAYWDERLQREHQAESYIVIPTSP